MSKFWVILDCNYLCYRSFYGIPELKHEDVLTGVSFGFLRDLRIFQDRYSTTNAIFCWDYGESFRVNICPTYKEGRKKLRAAMSEEERNRFNELHRQMRLLRDEYLPEIGYQNIFYKEGFEADDLIASICNHSVADDDEVVIVSKDKDLYQLLTSRVSILSPGSAVKVKEKFITKKSFIEKYGLRPIQWIDVKSMMGEKDVMSDCIPGIDGIGEVYATKYLRGELKTDSAAYRKILAGTDIWRKNQQIVTLPYPGTPKYELKEDEITQEGWRNVCHRLGVNLKSFR